MPEDALAALSARAVLAGLQARDFSCREYCGALLARHAAMRALNAFTYLDAGQALAQADEADRLRAAGRVPPGVTLAGLPLAVKDNIDTPGFATSAGNAWLRADMPARPAPVWQALAAHGAVLLGKANMHELAAGATSRNPLFGRVGNPVTPERIAGGSSGGTAAAVAAGLAPAGLGTDTSGSLRTPASFCGIAALRPTTAGRRAWPAQGVVPLTTALDTAGPMARDVADLALLHRAVTGARAAPPVAAAGVRLGIPRRYFLEGLEGSVDGVIDASLRALVDAGVQCVPFDAGDLAEQAVRQQLQLGRAGRVRDLRAWLAERLPGVDVRDFIAAIRSDDVRAIYLDSPHGAEGEREAAQMLDALRQRWIELMDAHRLDAMAYPCAPVTAPRVSDARGTPGDTVLLHGQAVSLGMIVSRNARFAAGLGLPALVLPAGRSEDGLCVGLELAARPADDARLLAVGEAVEAVLAGMG